MERVVEVSIAEESLAVMYDSDAFMRASADAAPSVFLAETRFAQSRANVDVLVEAIVSWDLFDDDGRVYPITRDSLSELPIHLLYKIVQAIEADVFAPDP